MGLCLVGVLGHEYATGLGRRTPDGSLWTRSVLSLRFTKFDPLTVPGKMFYLESRLLLSLSQDTSESPVWVTTDPLSKCPCSGSTVDPTQNKEGRVESRRIDSDLNVGKGEGLIGGVRSF